MSNIHPTAIIDPTAEIGNNVTIGAYCHIGPHVKLGDDCVLHNHVVLEGPSQFGRGNEFFPFAVLGKKTQDLKYKGEPTFLEVGDYNVFRENCNINRSTTPETKTIIGNHNLFLVNTHCGHECIIGNHCIFSGYAAAAGHCQVDDYAIVSGYAALHQFVRVGCHSLIGGCARVTQDVPPFTIVEGHHPSVRAINSIGMQRHGFSEEDIRALKQVYKTLFLHKGCNMTEGIESLLAHERFGENKHLRHLIAFLNESQRGYVH